ncbi:helix-turn-helix domain-containing protein [Cupriavidus taiwanensis]|uniref:helix-turn-helix domain-containing protein n=1 Tax=Cupriavidus taiwanensis TaxID=164546 RepID=UPI0020C5FE08|nr:helix-turn-helix domain-containing protein [Cupriavidus taiwanensis]
MHYTPIMVQKTDMVNGDGTEIRAGIGARLKEERERLGYSQPAFAALGGASKGSQLAWEKGSAMPNAEFLHIAASVGVDVLYVVTGRRNTSSLGAEEEAVIAGYRMLDARGRTGVLALISGMQPPVATPGRTGMVFHGQVGEVKNIEGDYQQNEPVTINVGGKKKRTK